MVTSVTYCRGKAQLLYIVGERAKAEWKLGHSLTVSQNFFHATQSFNFQIFTQEKQKHIHTKMYMNIHSTFVYNSPQVEIIHMSIKLVTGKTNCNIKWNTTRNLKGKNYIQHGWTSTVLCFQWKKLGQRLVYIEQSLQLKFQERISFGERQDEWLSGQGGSRGLSPRGTADLRVMGTLLAASLYALAETRQTAFSCLYITIKIIKNIQGIIRYLQVYFIILMLVVLLLIKNLGQHVTLGCLYTGFQNN